MPTRSVIQWHSSRSRQAERTMPAGTKLRSSPTNRVAVVMCSQSGLATSHVALARVEAGDNSFGRADRNTYLLSIAVVGSGTGRLPGSRSIRQLHVQTGGEIGIFVCLGGVAVNGRLQTAIGPTPQPI